MQTFRDSYSWYEWYTWCIACCSIPFHWEECCCEPQNWIHYIWTQYSLQSEKHSTEGLPSLCGWNSGSVLLTLFCCFATTTSCDFKVLLDTWKVSCLALDSALCPRILFCGYLVSASCVPGTSILAVAQSHSTWGPGHLVGGSQRKNKYVMYQVVKLLKGNNVGWALVTFWQRAASQLSASLRIFLLLNSSSYPGWFGPPRG